jgi:putative restriction endonuclease
LKFWVGVTDNHWYNFLSQLQPDEVNFWQPGGNTDFRALSPGDLFLFKLKSPANVIAGGGYFVSHSRIPVSLAWEAFGNKNGTADFNMLRAKILSLRHGAAGLDPDPTIGCIILTRPFFLPPDAWLPVPADWSPNIVQGKTYTIESRIGAQLFTRISEAISHDGAFWDEPRFSGEEERVRYGAEFVTRSRLGQGSFKVLVTDAYNRRCAMTGERTLPVLESAHIKPYALSGPHNISNGLLLRSDLHKLFDKGLITVTSDLHIEVSNRIKSLYENGRDYYALQGRALISMPKEPLYRPSREYIEWHNDNVFKAQ